MSGTRLAKKRGSVPNLVIPENQLDRRVSLTAYTNVVLDHSNPDKLNDKNEDSNKVRVRFADLPTVEQDMSGIAKPLKRKYSVALQTLKPFRPSSTDGKLPINKAGFFSFVLISWFSPLVWKLYKNRDRPVAEGDIWACSEEEGFEVNSERLERLWKEELDKKGAKKASFTNCWIKFITTRSFVSLALITMSAISGFLSAALLLKWIVAYLEADYTNVAYGVGLAVGMLVGDLVRGISFALTQAFGAQTGARFRSGFMGIMYKKLLKLRMVKGSTNSEILNVFSVDSYRVFVATWTAPYLLSLPVFLSMATVYSYILIGYWCFIAIGTFAVLYVTQLFLTRRLKTLRRLTVQYTDMRVKRMSEVLGNMKFIKMYAWEKPFTTAIKGIRKFEKKYLFYSAIVNSIAISIIPASPTISSIITISAYYAAGNELEASTVFAIIGTMDFLRVIVALLPFALSTYQEAKVSFTRVKKLLLMDELSPPSDEVYDNSNAVELKAAYFIWEVAPDTTLPDKQKKRERANSVASRRESINLFTLNDINLDIRMGELIGICGPVGSGKSSLMATLMGRMLQTRGHLAVNGNIAYSAQQAWIFNASLKQNILFGLEYDEERYRRVISCCGLEPDLQVLADGDETEIGERGATLSGGQKQRVNLARAVYSNSDIYLLDDPLSALDVKVSKEIFHKCIKGELKGKTVILATHQLQYLKHCDRVVVMDNGAIVETGLHEELLAAGEQYADMMAVFDKTTIKFNAKKNKPLEGHGDGEPSPAILKVKDTTEKEMDEPENSEPVHTTANGNAKPTQKKEKVKLVLAEEMAVGQISLETYKAYVNAAGGWFLIIPVLLLCCLASATQAFADFWLSIWIDSLPQSVLPSINGSTEANVTPTFNLSVSATPNFTGVSTSPETSTDNYDTNLYIYIGTLVAVMFLTIVSGFALAKACITASDRLHTQCLDKVMKARMFFFDSNPEGRILNRFSKDLDEGDVFVPQIATFALRLTTAFIFAIAITAYVSPYILIGMVPLVIVFYFMKKISAVTIRQLKRLENVARSPLIAHVNVTSQGLATIVSYGQQEHFFKSCTSFGDVASMFGLLFEISMRWVGIRLDAAAALVTFSASLTFVLSKGVISPALAALVLATCGKNLKTVQFLLRVMNEAEARFTSIERLYEYTQTVESESQTANKFAKEKWPENGGVSFRNVVMKYRSRLDPVLRDVSFDINPNEKVGIVGRTGAGKSSLAAVLFRLVELTEGQVTIDGENIADLHLNAIRSRLSTITQDPVLFAETIRHNLDPFSTYTDDEIWQALEKVHMKEKIQLSDEGLEAMVDDNGQNFSVGERQLLCLARALLRNSKILLLDEATANIDTSTDALIQQTIQEYFADCTVITIAHRLNTILHCNKIIVLDAGQVMECASPQDLLSDPHSFFNAMIAAQSVKTPTPMPL